MMACLDSSKLDTALATLDGELRCGVCNKLLSDPVSLPCSCVLCRVCAFDSLEGPGVYKSECPACNFPCHARDLQANTKVAALVQLYRRLVAERQAGAALRDTQTLAAASPRRCVALPSEGEEHRHLTELQLWTKLQQSGAATCTLEELEADVQALQEGLQAVAAAIRELQFPSPDEEEDEAEEFFGAALAAAQEHPSAHAQGASAPEDSSRVLEACTQTQLRKLCRNILGSTTAYKTVRQACRLMDALRSRIDRAVERSANAQPAGQHLSRLH
jgi:hypothetical protein